MSDSEASTTAGTDLAIGTKLGIPNVRILQSPTLDPTMLLLELLEVRPDTDWRIYTREALITTYEGLLANNGSWRDRKLFLEMFKLAVNIKEIHEVLARKRGAPPVIEDFCIEWGIPVETAMDLTTEKAAAGHIMWGTVETMTLAIIRCDTRHVADGHAYVKRVKSQYMNVPHFYEEIVEILKAYQRGSKSLQEVYDEANVIFCNTSRGRLMGGLRKFLPLEVKLAAGQNEVAKALAAMASEAAIRKSENEEYGDIGSDDENYLVDPYGSVVPRIRVKRMEEQQVTRKTEDKGVSDDDKSDGADKHAEPVEISGVKTSEGNQAKREAEDQGVWNDDGEELVKRCGDDKKEEPRDDDESDGVDKYAEPVERMGAKTRGGNQAKRKAEDEMMVDDDGEEPVAVGRTTRAAAKRSKMAEGM